MLNRSMQMSLKIDLRKVVQRDVLTDMASKIECLLYFKLMGIPIAHYQLWQASRDEDI